MSPYLNEREELIKRLQKLTPYSKNWLEQQSTLVLLAIFSKHHQSPSTNLISFNKRKVERKYENGICYIKVDSGEWEEEQD